MAPTLALYHEDLDLIVGRDEEIGLLNQILLSIPQTGGRLVLACGEAGIGKSALIDGFLAQIDPSCNKFTTWCDPLNTPRPLGPVRDIASYLLKTDVATLKEADYFDGIVAFAQGSDQTLVLVIEDLHWVDQKTLDWLIFIGRRLSQLPILLIGSFRDDEIGPSHALQVGLAAIPASRKSYIDIPALSVEAVRQMGDHDGFTAEELHGITNGHPYFVSELLNSDVGPSELPRSVSDVINARFETLSPDLQRFLEVVACSPGEMRTAILQKLPFDDLPTLCDEAVARRILEAVGQNLKFRHELARLAVYARIGLGKKRQAHAMFLAAHLARPESAQELDTIVYHAEGAQDPVVLLEYAQKAATKAAALGAHREAALFLGSALTCLETASPETCAEVNERWAYEAGLSLAIDDKVIAARERAIELWRSIARPDRVGENLRWLSRLHWYRGEADKAEDYILQAIEILENDAPSSETGKAYALRAQFFMLQENMSDAVKWAERALDVAVEMDDFDTQAHALNTIGSAKLFRGELAGEAHLRESLAIAHEHALHEQAARAYTNLSECLIELRQLDRAETLIEEGIAFDTAHDLDAWTFYLIGRKAQLRFEQDRYDEAILIAQGVLNQPNQTLLMQMPARIILARAGIRLGNAEAEAVLAEALSHAGQIGEPQYLVSLLVARLELAVLGNDPQSAAGVLDQLSQLDATVFSPTKRSDYLFWAHMIGVALDHTDVPKPYAQFLGGAHEDAATAFRAEGEVYLAGWALVKQGSVSAIARADADFQSCAAMGARRALRLRADLPAVTGHPRGRYRAAKEHPYNLTAKEQIVLALMADGKNNALIADDLSRSRRTVENHVSSILAKLTCNNRLEAVLRTHSEPWILPQNQ